MSSIHYGNSELVVGTLRGYRTFYLSQDSTSQGLAIKSVSHAHTWETGVWQKASCPRGSFHPLYSRLEFIGCWQDGEFRHCSECQLVFNRIVTDYFSVRYRGDPLEFWKTDSQHPLPNQYIAYLTVPPSSTEFYKSIWDLEMSRYHSMAIRLEIPYNHSNETPHKDCSCGFYAFHTSDWLTFAYKDADVGLGVGINRGQFGAVVEAKGKIRFGDRGFRAESMRIIALIEPPDRAELLPVIHAAKKAGIELLTAEQAFRKYPSQDISNLGIKVAPVPQNFVSYE